MEISFKKAIYAPFNDKKWYQKVGMAVLLFVPALLASVYYGEKSLIASSLGFIASFLLGGYSWIIWHNEINSKENILPEWDFIKVAYLAVQGFIISLGYFLISLPIIAIFIALFFYLKSLQIAVAIIGVTIAIFWYLVLVPIAQGSFTKDFQLIEAFNFQKVFEIAKKSWHYYLLALLYLLVFGLIFGFTSGLIGFIVGLLGIFPKFTSGLIMQTGQVLLIIATANLYGQTFKKAAQTTANE